MNKMMITAITVATLGAVALPVFAQTQQCSEGYHYDTSQQKCVKHGG